MRRFFNSVWLFALLWSGPLVFVVAWAFICWTAGFLNAALFIGLATVSQTCTRLGPTWAARFVERRIFVRQCQMDQREGRIVE